MRKKEKFKNVTSQFDYDFVKEKFDNDNLAIPDALGEENIKALIEGKKPERIKFVNTKSFKAGFSAVACLALVFAIISFSYPKFSNNEVPTNPSVSENPVANIASVKSFADYDEIKTYVKDTFPKSEGNFGANLNFNSHTKGEAVYGVGESADIASGETTSIAETYRQVDAVDEADVIKTDGKYIYYLDQYSNDIGIYKADDSAKLVATIKDFEYGADSTVDYFNVEMFLYKNNLVVTTNESHYDKKNYQAYSSAYIYDISNPEKPKLENKFKHNGYGISTRMIDGNLYMISNKGIDRACKKTNDYLPTVIKGSEDEAPISIKDICCINDTKEPNYLIASVIDIDSKAKITKTKAILGAGSQVYCNEKNLYVIGSIYNDSYYEAQNGNEEIMFDMAFLDYDTQIFRISLENEIEFVAEGKVEGIINDQFSLNEKDGYLRIATTSMNDKNQDVNNLFVLDSNLKKVGEVTGFAKDESIKSVNYIGDMAYVITYEQTDPLFVIDVSNPKAPEIKGEVKISGFSTMLIPVDDNTLLGIGFSDKQGEFGVETNGLKLALFDISNPTQPKVLDSKAFVDYDSDAQYNHKALVINKDKDYYALPYSLFRADSQKDETGILTFEIKNGKIKMTEQFRKTGAPLNVPRCTYVDDSLYLLNGYKDITVFTK